MMKTQFSIFLSKLIVLTLCMFMSVIGYSQNKISLKASNGSKTGFDSQKLRCLPSDETISVEYSGKGYLKAEVMCPLIAMNNDVKKILSDIETIYLVNKKSVIRGYPNYTLEFKYVNAYNYSFEITKRTFKE